MNAEISDPRHEGRSSRAAVRGSSKSGGSKAPFRRLFRGSHAFRQRPRLRGDRPWLEAALRELPELHGPVRAPASEYPGG